MQSSGGAKAGHASLMRPNRPLPTLPFAKLPLRRDPNAAAAIVAARITRGHRTSVRFSHIMSLGAAQDAARQRVGVGGILDHDGTIDEHGRTGSARILVRLRVGRTVAKIAGIEDRQVRTITLPQETAIFQLERARCCASHLMNRDLK